ncbi:OpgC domain-containing protein [Bradyrhizobium sp. BRP19]|uniref:OpgC domain-containing protein n=1 Tax=Bradyrhizobium sp. BRP19 TaxID=2793823 RepID=UPI001CD3E233|nr:OpgC domain-containing protein [Bradyrhizobium sp. BRP19]MCA1545558.1 OpgC domain-containing protein [Bradyrhizobium sp. BRP19]
MKLALALPPPQRDLRLDLFRGLANWAMFLGHVPGTVLVWCSFRNYGFSDGADLFVFISGYTSALVYTRKMERGFVFGTSRLFRRVWQIYTAHIVLFMIYLAFIHFLSERFNAPDLIDLFNAGPVTSAPIEMMRQGLLLRYKPLNLDVLPLYVVLMGLFPPILWLMLRFPDAAMIGSVLLYLAARQFHWNLPSYPSGSWYFNPLAWQLLFVTGAWLALTGAGRLHFLLRSRFVLVVAVAYLIFAAIMTLAAHQPQLRALFAPALFELFNPNDKTNLAPYRYLHLMVLIILGARFIPIDARGLQATILRPLVKCGQQSLEVFCVGILLAFIGYFILQLAGNGILAQLLVGAAGIAIMTAVAYYRSWSKRVEKPSHESPVDGKRAPESTGPLEHLVVRAAGTVPQVACGTGTQQQPLREV